MNENEIVKMLSYNSLNKWFTRNCGIEMLMQVMETLSHLDSQSFKEFNENAKFDLSDIPVNFSKLPVNTKDNCKFSYSEELNKTIEKLLIDINTPKLNIEYPLLLLTEQPNSQTYTQSKNMNKGTSQTCTYDWQVITEQIKNAQPNTTISLFHTHPKPIGRPHDTIYENNKEILSKLGFKPNGLNISVSDIMQLIKLKDLTDLTNKNLTSQSIVLMHNGTLINFSLNEEVVLDNIQHLDKEKILQNSEKKTL